MENFRNHKYTIINLGKINFFIGGNNAGKSSILGGIEWGLTGNCRWTDKAGRGAAELIMQGEKKATVTLEVEGIGGIVRTMPPTALQVGNKSGINQGQAEIYNHFTVTEEQLKTALNANAFLSMSTAEQRSFLFSAFGYSWDREKAVTALTHWLIANGYSEHKATYLVNIARGWYPANISGGPEVLEVMEKRSKEYRRDIKRDKQRMEAALAEMEPSIIQQTPTPGELKAMLSELRNQRDKLISSTDHLDISQRRETLLNRIQAKEEKIQAAINKRDEVKEKLQQISLIEHGYNEAEEKELQDTLRELTGLSVHLEADINDIQRKIVSLREAIEALDSTDRRCPLASGIIECGMNNAQLADVVQILNDQFNTAHEILAGTLTERQDIDQELVAINKKLTALAQLKQAHEAQTKQTVILNGELKTQTFLIDQLTADINTLKKELDTLPIIDETKVTETNQLLNQLDYQITESEATLHKANEIEAFNKHQETLKADLKAITEELADIEVLVKALAPNGLRRDLLEGILKEFLQRTNDRLGRLTSGAYRLFLNNDMELVCRANGGPLLPLKLLSKSEQLRVGIAIQESLSAAAGLKFIAIDEADMLDQENRDLLAGMLLNLATEYDQVLVFTTVGDVKPQNPGLPNLKMFWVEEGTVTELEPSA
jgi:exonuclease SbcC